MNSFDREEYLEQLRMYYSGDRDDTEQFLEDMRDSLDCYLKDHPSATPAEIFQYFGHPKELQEQYENAIIRRQSKRKQIFSRILIVLICAVCLMALGAFIIHSRHVLNEVNGHADVILEEYPEVPNSSDTTPSPKPKYHIIE